MTIHADPDNRLLRLAAGLDRLVAEESRRQRAAEIEMLRSRVADGEILKACEAVGRASDAVEQARLAGGGTERNALRRLERAAKALAETMRRHGRAG